MLAGIGLILVTNATDVDRVGQEVMQLAARKGRAAPDASPSATSVFGRSPRRSASTSTSRRLPSSVDLHRFCSGHVLMLGGPLFEGHW